jgi:hypothetical protein
MPTGIAYDAIEQTLASDGSIAALTSVVAHVVHIHCMKGVVCLHRIRAIFAVGAEEATVHVFAAGHRATLAILALHLRERANRKTSRQFLEEETFCFREAAPCIEVH